METPTYNAGNLQDDSVRTRVLQLTHVQPRNDLERKRGLPKSGFECACVQAALCQGEGQLRLQPEVRDVQALAREPRAAHLDGSLQGNAHRAGRTGL